MKNQQRIRELIVDGYTYDDAPTYFMTNPKFVTDTLAFANNENVGVVRNWNAVIKMNSQIRTHALWTKRV